MSRLLLLSAFIAASLANSRHYVRHPGRFLYKGQGQGQTSWSNARSPLDCFQACTSSTNCTAVNLCTFDIEGNCTLLSDSEVGMEIVKDKSCFTGEKFPIRCQNGGTVVNSGLSCFCPPQYGGLKCERYIRDCSEPSKAGYNTSYNGVFLIQPVDSPNPFNVKCQMSWGGTTTTLVRSAFTSLNWTTVKRGYGMSSLPSTPNADFFIGLDNLYYLTNQAPFHMNLPIVQGAVWGAAYYNPFYVDTESARYQLHAMNFYHGSGGTSPVDNGFTGTAPLLFSTLDKDPEGCAAKHNGSGWYGPDCSTGHGFFNTLPTWPVGGVDKNVTRVQFIMTRQGKYYIEK